MTLRETLTYEPSELRFGTSGLRGLVTDMTDLECYINTRGFLKYLDELGHLQEEAGVVYVSGDLRHSTPRVVGAVTKAVEDAGLTPIYCGLIPTPALAYFALEKKAPCVMVTGSHIPDDRNGIKFYRADGEPLKSDEAPIFDAITKIRAELYNQDSEGSIFNSDGMLKEPAAVPSEQAEAADAYSRRYLDVFGPEALKGKKIVFYQHSSVGRDSLVDLLVSLGAEVVPVGRSEAFIPIDTENVTPKDQAYFKQLASEHSDAFAIVSTDGDSDRPFVIDSEGTFHRGDVLGAVVAKWLKADFAAYPVSASDATDSYLESNGISYVHTRIGSPYVIALMEEGVASGNSHVVGWEVNGGMLTGSDMQVNGQVLKALPTRDAILPIIVALIAASEVGSVKELFAQLPPRFTQAGLINNFPTEVSLDILERFAEDNSETRQQIERFFTPEKGFGKVTDTNTIDGLRIFFDNGDIAHMRPSGNAPQLRCYSIADSQERADQIVEMAIAEPDGIFRQIEKATTK